MLTSLHTTPHLHDEFGRIEVGKTLAQIHTGVAQHPGAVKRSIMGHQYPSVNISDVFSCGSQHLARPLNSPNTLFVGAPARTATEVRLKTQRLRSTCDFQHLRPIKPITSFFPHLQDRLELDLGIPWVHHLQPNLLLTCQPQSIDLGSKRWGPVKSSPKKQTNDDGTSMMEPNVGRQAPEPSPEPENHDGTKKELRTPFSSRAVWGTNDDDYLSVNTSIHLTVPPRLLPAALRFAAALSHRGRCRLRRSEWWSPTGWSHTPGER